MFSLSVLNMLYGHSPDAILESVGCSTTLVLKDSKEIEGYLYTIDPQTENIVLFKGHQVHVIMNHLIQTIKSKKQKKNMSG